MLKTAQYTERYEAMSRAHFNGAKDGNDNVPPSSQSSLSQTELKIAQLAQDDLNLHASKIKQDIDNTRDSLRTWRAALPADISSAADAFRGRAELLLNEVERELLRLFEDVLGKQQEYRFFKTVNRLNRDAQTQASTAVAFSWLVLIIVADGALNAFFFKDTNPLALAGGFLLAGSISLVNTSLGFGAGLVPWRYMHHRNRLHLVWAFPLLVIMLTLILLFNLSVGQYRDLLASRKDAEMIDLVPAMIAAPLNLQSLSSIMLATIGAGIALFAAYKGYNYFDPYPSFGKYFRRKEEARDRFDERLGRLQKEIDEMALSAMNGARSDYRAANKLLQNCAKASDDALNRRKAGNEVLAGIAEACSTTIRLYRDANVQVRDTRRYPPPAYFAEPYHLSIGPDGASLAELERERQEIQELIEKSKVDFEAVCKSIPAVARQLLSEAALNDRLTRIKAEARETHKANQAKT